MTNDILFEEIPGKHGNVGLITLNRQQVLNALNHAMFIALDKQLKAWEKNNNIKAVIIRASEGRAFCAGGDIRYAYERGKAKDPELPLFFRDEYRLNLRIFHYPKPYIALLDGITMGGGVGISLYGQYRIATEKLTFAMPETGIGFFPDVGGSYFLSRLPFKAGYYLGLTGARISAADCLQLGIVNYLVGQEALAKLISVVVDTSMKDLADRFLSFTIIPNGSELLKHKNEIETCFSKKTMEEIIQALNDYKSEWCSQTAKLLQSKSPTSLKVTLRALQQGQSLVFDACMQMEYRLANHFLQGHDFYEGVRAAIIDKDQSPCWQPAELQQVTEEQVLAYFAPVGEEL
jgi:enoyl-CoA hydratase